MAGIVLKNKKRYLNYFNFQLILILAFCCNRLQETVLMPNVVRKYLCGEALTLYSKPDRR